MIDHHGEISAQARGALANISDYLFELDGAVSRSVLGKYLVPASFCDSISHCRIAQHRVGDVGCRLSVSALVSDEVLSIVKEIEQSVGGLLGQEQRSTHHRFEYSEVEVALYGLVDHYVCEGKYLPIGTLLNVDRRKLLELFEELDPQRVQFHIQISYEGETVLLVLRSFNVAWSPERKPLHGSVRLSEMKHVVALRDEDVIEGTGEVGVKFVVMLCVHGVKDHRDGTMLQADEQKGCAVVEPHDYIRCKTVEDFTEQMVDVIHR